jgi:pimeloyl-ACP methyl ester carboxylesterase
MAMCSHRFTLLTAVLLTLGSRSQAPAVREGHIVTADSTRLFYRVVGSAPDTVIAIHGGPGVDLESIAGDFAPLAQRHTVIFYDQRGARVKVPTLVVHGEQESIPMDLVEEWVTSLPHARLVKVPKAAHFVYAEQPAVVWLAVDRFLADRVR